MTVGQRVREIRKQRGLTLKEVAEATGLSLTYLSDVERERTQPSLKTLQRIAGGLNVTTTDLMRGVANLGEETEEALPPGLREFIEDPYWKGQVNSEWIETLMRVDYRGKRPETMEGWRQLFLTLQGIIKEPKDQPKGG